MGESRWVRWIAPGYSRCGQSAPYRQRRWAPPSAAQDGYPPPVPDRRGGLRKAFAPRPQPHRRARAARRGTGSIPRSAPMDRSPGSSCRSVSLANRSFAASPCRPSHLRRARSARSSLSAPMTGGCRDWKPSTFRAAVPGRSARRPTSSGARRSPERDAHPRDASRPDRTRRSRCLAPPRRRRRGSACRPAARPQRAIRPHVCDRVHVGHATGRALRSSRVARSRVGRDCLIVRAGSSRPSTTPLLDRSSASTVTRSSTTVRAADSPARSSRPRRDRAASMRSWPTAVRL